jgi:hypothetical protein
VRSTMPRTRRSCAAVHSMPRTTKRAREHSANYAARQRGRRAHRTATHNIWALCSGAERVRVLHTRSRRGRPRRHRSARGEEARAVSGIMSRYAQRSAAGTAKAQSASGRITDTMPGPFRAARGPRRETPNARNPRRCRIASGLALWHNRPRQRRLDRPVS